MSDDRYLALISTGAHPDEVVRITERAADLGLVSAFTSTHLTVFIAPDTKYQSLGSIGILLGRFFPTQDLEPADLGAQAIASGGRQLVAAGWGDYVAFLAKSAKGPVLVVRAPSGGLPAFRIKIGNAILIASDVETLLRVSEVQPRIDWSFVVHHLAFPHLRGRATGLAGIDELFAGDATFFEGGNCERVCVWSPWHFAAREFQLLDPVAARAAVRKSVDDAVEALARPFESILLELSGGLDSSILAAALRRCAAPTCALNLVTPGGEGDERHYASLAAEQSGIPLETQFVPADLDLTLPVHSRTPRPGIPSILRMADRLFAHAAVAHKADAFFSGSGGDCTFCSPASTGPAADALLHFGLGWASLRAVREIADVHGSTVWSAARMAWSQAHRPPLHRIWPRLGTFLDRDSIPSDPVFHPWLVEPADALPGRRSHIRAIVATFAHLDGYGRQAVAPSVFPLLSQPVMEACLRVPTWLWIEGGRDRAVARAAFQGALPRQILERRTKGGMDAYCVRNFERNRRRLLPYLLEGHLAGAGLLDRAELWKFLNRPVGIRDDRFYRLLPIIDVEAWLRGWLGDAPAT